MGNNFTHVFLTEGEAGLPYDPVGHGGSRFPLVGPVLRFTLEQNPVFLDWTQTPTTALRPVCSPATLWGRKTIINRMIKPPPFLEYIEIFHCFLLFSSPKRQYMVCCSNQISHSKVQLQGRPSLMFVPLSYSETGNTQVPEDLREIKLNVN